MIGRALTYVTPVEPGPAITADGVGFAADALTIYAHRREVEARRSSGGRRG